MDNRFFANPILNSPYAVPQEHWELDADGLPSQVALAGRRPVRFLTPIPKPKKQSSNQIALTLHELSTEKQQLELGGRIEELRQEIAKWRNRPDSKTWHVSPETARLLQHWRTYDFQGPRPFFCQIEAVETVIWLTEVAPNEREGKRFLVYLESAREAGHSPLSRLALKLATGSGKTTVMAMLIAWQTVNAVRHPQSKRFTRAFLIVTPGITIRDRLRVLLPNDPENLYATRELVPPDLLIDLQRAKLVVTNYHAFKLRERLELSKGGRALLQGHDPELQTLETEGQMIQRVMPELMNHKNILVLNDEAHHCYRERPGAEKEDEALKGDDKKEAKENIEAFGIYYLE